MIEEQILQNLLYDESYMRKVIPYLKDQYFAQADQKIVFRLMEFFIKRYNKCPSKEALLIDLERVPGLAEEVHKNSVTLINSLAETKIDQDWLVNETERFCQDRAIYNAIMSSIKILDGKDKKLDKGAIPNLLNSALGVSFDSSIGHSYLKDWEKRFNFYHNTEKRIPFNLEYFNKITKGGLKPKTINVILAGTAVGKTAFMCHCAAHNLLQGFNVLYITLEMAEEEISQRIDANLFGITMDEVEILPKDAFKKKIDRVVDKTGKGRLIVKEYPTASANVDHFRHLLNELKVKQDFVPQIIYVDYLNICSSSRLKYGNGNVNSYAYVKSITEELRGLAQEYGPPIFSGTQVNRAGFTSSDPGMEDTSESFGLPMTVDFLFAAVSSEQLEKLGQVMIKQLKSRYSNISKYRKFVIGYDKERMTFFDVEQDAQDLIEGEAVFDSTPSGSRIDSEKFKVLS